MLERKVIATILTELASVAPDLKRAISTEADFEVAMKVWGRTIGTMSIYEARAAVDMALCSHNERNITPAHVINYRDQAVKAASHAPLTGDLFADIVDGTNNWPYHSNQIDGGWQPKHGDQTNRLATLLGGWSVISADGVNMDVLRSNAMKAFEQMQHREQQVRRLPASALSLTIGSADITNKLKDMTNRIGETPDENV